MKNNRGFVLSKADPQTEFEVHPDFAFEVESVKFSDDDLKWLLQIATWFFTNINFR